MPTTLAARDRSPARDLRTVPVALSTAVAPLLRGPASGSVLAAFPSAVYVGLDTGPVLALVASDGLRLACALVVAAPSRQAPFAGHAAGERAAVADGDLLLGGVCYRPVRTWALRERTSGALQPAAVARLGALLGPAPHDGEVAARLLAGATALEAALRTGAGLPTAAGALLGLGPGLTPAGDDVLAGALVTSAQLGHPVSGVRAEVDARAAATTALSADLLRHACAGRAAGPVLGLVDALVGGRPVEPALAALLAVGATSGHDTATGVLLAARALLTRQDDA